MSCEQIILHQKNSHNFVQNILPVTNIINLWCAQKKLKDNAIPSIIDFPTSFKKYTNPINSLANRQHNSINNLNDSL